MLTLDSYCEFTWGFGQEFLVQDLVTKKFYIWSDPDYNGDNTIATYSKDPEEFGFGRDKGKHVLRDYCGDHVVFILFE